MFMLSMAVIALAFLLAAGIEKSSRTFLFNAVNALWYSVFIHLVSPAAVPLIAWMGGKFGRPPVHLSGHGWEVLGSVLLLLAATDFTDYSFHRLQHRVPWLWAMHSLHHSDPAMNGTTAYRNYWLEGPIKILVFAPLGLIFRSDTSVFVITSLILWTFPVFIHLNRSIGFRKAPWILVSPQFHRVHHSVIREHFDSNFSTFLPLWDLLFGTYLEPQGFPETGLDEGAPHGFHEMLLWPARNLIKLQSSFPASPESTYSKCPPKSP